MQFKNESDPFNADEEALIDKIVKHAAAVITTALQMKAHGERATGSTFKTYDNLGHVIEEHASVDIALRELSRRRLRAADLERAMQAAQAMDEDRGDATLFGDGNTGQ